MGGASPSRRSSGKTAPVGHLLSSALVLVAVYAACRSRLQVASVTGFWIAAGAMWLWGRWVVAFLATGGARGVRPARGGFFTTIYLGQFALLLIASLLLPLNALAARLVGVGCSLPTLVLAATGALLIAHTSGRRPTQVRAPSDRDPQAGASFVLTVLGVVPASAVVALYSRHLSALGLDVHEHMYWALHIVDAGYVPLAERHTDILSDYPKGFHLLCALWNASGMLWFMGPTVKAMPFLQSWLPAMAVNELVLDRYRRTTRCTEGAARIVACALGIGLTAYAYLLVPMVYPIWELIGTARFSSNGLLFLPLALALLGSTRRWPRAVVASTIVIPVFLLWALIFNVAVFAAALCFVLPYYGSVLVLTRARAATMCRRRLVSWCMLAVLTAAAIAVEDPAVLAGLARHSDAVAALAASALGVRTPEDAARSGEVPQLDKYIYMPREAPPACGDVACYVGMGIEAAGTTAWQAARYPARVCHELVNFVMGTDAPTRAAGFKSVLGFRLANTKPYGAAILFLTPIVLLGAAGSVALRRRARQIRGTTAAEWGCMMAILVGTAIGNFGHVLVADMTERLRIGGGPIMQLVAAYVRIAGLHMGPFFYWIIPAFALSVLAAEITLARPGKDARRSTPLHVRRGSLRLGVAVLGVLWIGLAAHVDRLETEAADHPGWGGSVHRRDLRALRKIERMIPATDAVLVPAEHREIGNEKYAENWIFPVGATTALLPYVRGRFVFNVSLGYGRLFGWQQLRDDLCAPDGNRRARFVRTARIRWFFMRAPQLDRREVFDAVRVCGRTLAELGVVFPPVVVERQQALFAVE